MERTHYRSVSSRTLVYMYRPIRLMYIRLRINHVTPMSGAYTIHYTRGVLFATLLRRAFKPPLLDGVWGSRADRPRQHESATTPTLSLSALPWPAPRPQFAMRALCDWERCSSSSTAVLPGAA